MNSTNYIMVKRHWVLMLMMTIKFFFFLIPIGILIWIFYSYSPFFSSDFSNYILLPTILISINYIFVQIILNIIDFHGRVILVSNTTVMIIRDTLILVDDVEFIQIATILKVDVIRRGFLPNILNYGHLVFEQTNGIRTVHYIPVPHQICQVVNSHILNNKLETSEEVI